MGDVPISYALRGKEKALRAARLLGAARRWRDTIGLPLLRVLQPGYNQLVSSLQNRLREPEFQQAWQAGAAMTGEESVAFALDVFRPG